MNTIRVVLVDDHPVARAGIRKFLEKEVDIQVVGEASSGEEALELIRDISPDILLLDMELPGLKGVDVAREVKEKKLPVRILALSTYDNKQYILGLLGSGASGYLTKEEVPEMIIDAVRGVARGENGWVSRRIAANLTHWMQFDGSKNENLTDREVEVLRQVVSGKTNQEIAVVLGISYKTVEKHIDSIYGKLGVASRVEAAVTAVTNKLV